VETREKEFDLIERHLHRPGEKQADYAKRVFNTTRASLDRWRKGEPMSSTNASKLSRLYDEAKRWEADSGRTDDDHRRRAIAAVNLLEGRSLKILADLGVALSTAQESGGDRQRGAVLAMEALAPLIVQIQNRQQTPASA